jgi:hypothetical protein
MVESIFRQWLMLLLTQCGITTAAEEQTNLINNEGFTLIEDIGVMKDDKEVYKMAKQLAKCTVADRHVNLSTVLIKHPQCFGILG